jgi:hypothetical protein
MFDNELVRERPDRRALYRFSAWVCLQTLPWTLDSIPIRTYHEHDSPKSLGHKRLKRERRRRRGENVAPVEAPQVERREAPHPYVTGVRAPDRNGARRTLARFARGASRQRVHARLDALRTPAPPGAPFPSSAREKEKGKGRRPAPENPSPRAA